MKRFTISERRMRGPRKSRVRVGPWPVILFVLLSMLAAIAGRWIERHYEAHGPWTAAPSVRAVTKSK